MGQFWRSHGTKVLGFTIAILSLLSAGSVALPPPLNKYSSIITAWAVFINTVMGVFVAARGYGNTAAIASQAVTQADAAGIPVQVLPAEITKVPPP